MNKTMEKLLAAQERAERQKQKADADLKRTLKLIAKEKTRERTHRLCTRGAYLEKLLQMPEALTDEDVFGFLDYVFSTPYAKTRLNALLETRRRQAEENGAETAEEAAESAGDFPDA